MTNEQTWKPLFQGRVRHQEDFFLLCNSTNKGNTFTPAPHLTPRCLQILNTTSFRTHLSWKISWAVTWSFRLMASVRGNRVFILERGISHFAVTSVGGSSILKICCWIGGRGSWGCKALCSRHCKEKNKDSQTNGNSTYMASLYFLVRDPPHLVWEGSVTHHM